MASLYHRELEALVAAFEDHRKTHQETCVESFFPARDHPRFQKFAMELLRVDLEYEFARGNRDLLCTYLHRFPDLVGDRSHLQILAFEEYRLRRQSGEDADRERYAARFGINTDDWPRWNDSRGVDQYGSIDHGYNEDLDFPIAGQSILDFTLIAELGRGTFSRVFLARQGNLADRFVVVKLTSHRWLESDLLARLQHNNIVPIFSVHEYKRLQLVCMPFLGCSTLADVLRKLYGKDEQHPPRSGEAFRSTIENHLAETLANTELNDEPKNRIQRQLTLSSTGLSNQWQRHRGDYVSTCLSVVLGIAEGLSHAHEVGIVHRDLKPANILITEEGRPLILDFNLSHDCRSAKTPDQKVGGTLPYMSPEHLGAMLGHDAPCAQSDLYSLGVTLYEMLTGKHPFSSFSIDDDSSISRMMSSRMTRSISVRPLNSAVPKSVESIVRKCLEPNRRHRYQNAIEVCDDIRCELACRPLRVAKNPSSKERVIKFMRRHPSLTSGMTVAIANTCLIIAILAAWLTRESHMSTIAAQADFTDFQHAFHIARSALGSPFVSEELVMPAIETVERQLKTYQLTPAGSKSLQRFAMTSTARHLPAEDRTKLERQLAELLFLMAAVKEGHAKSQEDREARAAMLQRALDLNELAMALARVEGSRAFYLQRAALLDALNRSEEATLHRQKSEEAPREGFFDAYLCGIEAARSGRLRHAIELLTRAAHIQPLDEAAWLARGQVFARQRAFEYADSDFSRCVALNPQSAVPLLCRGVTRLEVGKYELAEQDFTEAIQVNAVLPMAYIYRAIARTKLTRHAEAMIDLEKALQLGSNEVRIYVLRAELHKQQGNLKAAHMDLSRAMCQRPTDEMNWIARAMARLPSNPSSALADLEEALKINPNSYAALRNAAFVHSEHLASPEQAIVLMDRLLRDHPDDTDMIAARGVVLARIGRHEDAIQCATETLGKAMPYDAETLIHVACVYALVSDRYPWARERAVELVQQALQFEPHWVSAILVDADLDAIRQVHAFQEIVTAAQKLIAPNLGTVSVE